MTAPAWLDGTWYADMPVTVGASRKVWLLDEVWQAPSGTWLGKVRDADRAHVTQSYPLDRLQPMPEADQ